MIPVKNIRNSLLFSIDLQRTLNGFIVFEVAWSNVCGINYLNQLQVLLLLDAPHSICSLLLILSHPACDHYYYNYT